MVVEGILATLAGFTELFNVILGNPIVKLGLVVLVIAILIRGREKGRGNIFDALRFMIANPAPTVLVMILSIAMLFFISGLFGGLVKIGPTLTLVFMGISVYLGMMAGRFTVSPTRGPTGRVLKGFTDKFMMAMILIGAVALFVFSVEIAPTYFEETLSVVSLGFKGTAMSLLP